MTTMTIPSPVASMSVSRGRLGELVGLWVLLRLNLRRERIPLLIWILGVSAVAASTFSAIASLHPDQGERAALAASITANPAFLAVLVTLTARRLAPAAVIAAAARVEQNLAVLRQVGRTW